MRRFLLRRSISFWGAVLFATPPLAVAQPWSFPPVDESAEDASLVEFLDQLRDIVAREDGEALVALVSPEIKNSIDSTDGPDWFRRQWGLTGSADDPERSFVWTVLGRMLPLGGAWSNPASYQGPAEYCIPRPSVRFPNDVEETDHLVVTGAGVRLREGPASDAPIVRLLSWEIVRERDFAEVWRPVETWDGVAGYVHSQFLYSPMDYHACLQKMESGEWQIVTMLTPEP